jgi:hypothetical protein
MKAKKPKTCFDCFNCKVSKLSVSEPKGGIDKALTRPTVSAKSSDKCLFCFCSKTKKRKPHKETYWLTKPVCKKFEEWLA